MPPNHVPPPPSGLCPTLRGSRSLVALPCTSREAVSSPRGQNRTLRCPACPPHSTAPALPQGTNPSQHEQSAQCPHEAQSSLHPESSPAPSSTSSGAVPRRPTLLRTCLRAGQEGSPMRQPLPQESPNDKPTPCILSGSNDPEAKASTAHKQVSVQPGSEGAVCPQAQGHATAHNTPWGP